MKGTAPKGKTINKGLTYPISILKKELKLELADYKANQKYYKGFEKDREAKRFMGRNERNIKWLEKGIVILKNVRTLSVNKSFCKDKNHE